MARLETTEHWAQILELKDQLSLRELADRLSLSPGLISAALRRTQTTRTAVTSEPAEVEVASKPPSKSKSQPEAPVQAPAPPAGERPAWWSDIEADLDTLPLNELADRVGITTGTLARTLLELGHRREPVTQGEDKPSTAATKRTKRKHAGAQAWSVDLVQGGREEQVVVVARDLVEAVTKAQALSGTPVRVALLGRAIL